jgi:hypothetical protein
MTSVLGQFGTGQVLWSMLYFFLFFIWIWLLVSIFADIFRSSDLGGWGKALWSIFVIVLPFLGVFVYLIARGGKMQRHAIETAEAQDAAARQYIRSAVDDGPADQVSRLVALRNQGVIDEAEFQRLKARVAS